MQFWHVSTFFRKQPLVKSTWKCCLRRLENACFPCVFLVNALFPILLVTCEFSMSVFKSKWVAVAKWKKFNCFVPYYFKVLIMTHTSRIYLAWNIGIRRSLGSEILISLFGYLIMSTGYLSGKSKFSNPWLFYLLIKNTAFCMYI